MSNYTKGRAKEYEVMRILKKQGYHTFRMAGSHSPVDVIAVLWQNGTELPLIRFIQVKSGKYINKKDIQTLKQFKLPAIIKKELWHFRKYKSAEIINCD